MTNELRSEKTRVLVDRTQSGNREAREELFQRYSATVLGIVRRRLGMRLRRREQSQDILQSALLEALARLDTFQMCDEGSLVRWLARLVETTIRNRADYHHAAGRDPDREQPIEGSAAGRDGGSGPIGLPASQASLTREIVRKEEQALVRGCVDGLPERYRTVIVMRDFENASWPEIVECLRLPSENAARMVHLRAVEKLGELLRRRGIGGEGE